MDAAARAELDALRERAYGPSPDIARDRAALERLVALEDLALPAPRVREQAVPQPADLPIPPAVGPPPRSPRPWWHSALIAAVVVLAVPLGATAAQQALVRSAPPPAGPAESVRSALAFAQDPDTEALITVRIDGSFGDYVDIPSTRDVPLFPVEGLMTWVEPLGDYYGWKLWIGGASGAIEDENCLLLDGEGTMIADCVSIDLKSQGALLLTIAFADIPPEERPEGMTAGQSLGFWWGTDGVVRILLGPTPAD